MRRGPSGGYDFGNKRQYRRNIWRTFRDACKGRLSTAEALLMPSAEGDEIEAALNAGFREQNLHVVDDNPAIVAHLKRRYSRIMTYGIPVAEAARRIAKSGSRLAVANLDLCHNLSAPLRRTLFQFGAAEPMEQHGLIAVTMLRGREQGDCAEAMRTISTRAGSNDISRAWLAAIQLGSLGQDTARMWTPTFIRDGIYKSISGNQTMFWFVVRMCSKEWPSNFKSLQIESETIGAIPHTDHDQLAHLWLPCSECCSNG